MWIEPLTVEVLETFVEAGQLHMVGRDRASLEAKLWIAELSHVSIIKRAGRKVGMTHAEKIRRWRLANPVAYAAHREVHNTNRRAKALLARLRAAA